MTFKTVQLSCNRSRPEAYVASCLTFDFQLRIKRAQGPQLNGGVGFRAGLRLFALPRQLGSHSLGSLSFADVGVPYTVTSRCCFFRNAL